MGKQSVRVDDEFIDLQDISENLRALGVTTLFTSLVDSAGVIRGKSVPVNRLKTLCQSGVGASPSGLCSAPITRLPGSQHSRLLAIIAFVPISAHW